MADPKKKKRNGFRRRQKEIERLRASRINLYLTGVRLLQTIVDVFLAIAEFFKH